MPSTLPPLIFSALKLVRSLQDEDLPDDGPVSLKKVFQFLHQTVEALSVVPAPELVLRLYLPYAEAAGVCNLEPVAYEFFTQAFVIYEEEIADSKAQVSSLLAPCKERKCLAWITETHLCTRRQGIRPSC